VLRPAVAFAAVAALAAAVLILLPGPANDERPADRGASVRLEYRSDAAAAAVPILRSRLAAAGIAPADVSASADRVDLVVGAAARETLPALLQPGRLALYDWEASVIGGLEPVSGAEARARAARHPGAVAVRSETEPGRWFALAGTPPITNADVAGARAGTDPTTGEPVVIVSLTAEGRRTFGVLTRKLAQRGADEAFGGDPLQTSQHLAIVVDDRIASVPYINWQENPDGVDGAGGVQISGGLTADSARELAAVLSAGPLPQLTRP
jgi:preprotein translocase subunit SecD